MFYIKSYSSYGFDDVLENNDAVHVWYRNNIFEPFTASSTNHWAPHFTSNRDGG